MHIHTLNVGEQIQKDLPQKNRVAVGINLLTNLGKSIPKCKLLFDKASGEKLLCCVAWH